VRGPDEKAVNEKVVKKPYDKPQLIVYGDIREITRTSPKGGNEPDFIQTGNKTS